MKLGLHQSARLEQRLVQSPQMIQAMKILQLPALDLLERIQQELDENLMLELREPEEQAVEVEQHAAPERKPDGDQEGVQKMLEELERAERDYGDGSRVPTGDGDEGDRKLAALQNTPDLPKTMAEAMVDELAFLDLEDRERALAEFLIYSLDDHGYLTESLEELAAGCPTTDLAELEGETIARVAPQDEPAVEPQGEPEVVEPQGEPEVVEPQGQPEFVEPQGEPKAVQPQGEHKAVQPQGEHKAVQPQGQPEAVQPQGEPIAGLDLDGVSGNAAMAPAASLPDGEIGSAEPAVTAEELSAVLGKLRDLLHPGLGARDLRESLLLQLEASGEGTPLLISIVSNHLEDLQQNRLPRIAKETGQPIEDVKEAVEQLKRLDPMPGIEYGETTAAVILPDVMVELVDGEYVVRLDRQRIPELTLSRTYRELLKKAKKGDAVEAWLKKRLDSARWFIDAVTQRQSTLERIARVIFERQRPFLDKGLQALQTLRMQEIADQVGVHISTVSRAVSGKYAQTPRGIFPLKFFFTGGTTNVSGEVTSQVGIQQRIKELVEQEDPSRPLSDEEIAQHLKDKDRIQIARRTVTKYRKMLAIPSSSQRKQF